MKQYLITYQTSSYDGYSIVATTIIAADDAEAEVLSKRAWQEIGRRDRCGYSECPELYNLSDGREVLTWKERHTWRLRT